MRQRLQLATALLGDPEVLILDEPANGLDPQGIQWLRTFIRYQASNGHAVLVSSHLLSEMQETVDDVIIVSHGKLVLEAPLADLAHQGGTSSGLRIRTPELDRLAALLAAVPAGYRQTGPDTMVIDGATPEWFGPFAAQHQIVLYELTPTGDTLEDVFLRPDPRLRRGRPEPDGPAGREGGRDRHRAGGVAQAPDDRRALGDGRHRPGRQRPAHPHHLPQPGWQRQRWRWRWRWRWLRGRLLVRGSGTPGSRLRDPPHHPAAAQPGRLGAPGLLLALLLGVLMITTEFRHKTVTTSFLVTPRRPRLVAGKLITAAVVGAGLAVVMLVATVIGGGLTLVARGGSFSAMVHQIPAVAPGMILVFALFAVLGVGVGSFLTNQVAAIVVVLGWFIILEGILVALVHSAERWVPSGAATAAASVSRGRQVQLRAVRLVARRPARARLRPGLRRHRLAHPHPPRHHLTRCRPAANGAGRTGRRWPVAPARSGLTRGIVAARRPLVYTCGVVLHPPGRPATRGARNPLLPGSWCGGIRLERGRSGR